MDLEKLKNVETLFQRAIALPLDQQAAFITEIKEQDSALGDILEGLVIADQINDACIQAPIDKSIDDFSLEGNDV